MNQHQFFISGIGTDVGKTVVSSIFVEASGAHYWKPVQAGKLPSTDVQIINHLISRNTTIYPEAYLLNDPLSPHASAAHEGVEIALENFTIPTTDPLIVEGAGGLLVPLNEEFTMLDLMKQLKLPVVLVSRHYLGSINHTLMSIEVLRNHGLELEHLIFVGDNLETEAIIEKQSGVKATLKIPEVDVVDWRFVKEQASRLLQKISYI